MADHNLIHFRLCTMEATKSLTNYIQDSGLPKLLLFGYRVHSLYIDRFECYKLDFKNPNIKPGSMTDLVSIQLQRNQPGSATHPDLKVKSK